MHPVPCWHLPWVTARSCFSVMRCPLAEDGSFFLNSTSMLYLLISIQFNAFPMTKLICSQLLFIYYWSRPLYGREQHHDRLPFCEPIKIHFKVANKNEIHLTNTVFHIGTKQNLGTKPRGFVKRYFCA